MAARTESKQGLIITLVFFILLSLLLGVMTYLGFADKKEIEDKRDEYKTKVEKGNKELEFKDFQQVAWKEYMGHATNKDRETLSGRLDTFTTIKEAGGKKTRELKKEYADNNKETADLINTLNDKFGWQEGNQKRPASTYKGVLEDREKRIAELEGHVKNEQNKSNGVEANLAQAKEVSAERQKAFDEQIKKQKDTGFTDLQKYVAKIEELLKEKDELSQARATLQNDVGALQEKYEKEITKLRKDIDALNVRLAKAEDVKPKANFLDFDQPKGKILEVDRSGNMPFINLGRADSLKEGLTFSIHGTDLTGKPNKEPKGSLEVLQILGDRLSQARVSYLKDPNRDPLMKGDLLFNPTWSPGLRQHVAILGIIDLDGNINRDNAAQPAQLMRGVLEFKRLLEDQGVVVDAYLDLKENVVKGEITRQTDYLIRGENPSFAGALKDDDPRMEKKVGVVGTMNKAEQDAIRNGVTIIPVRRYLALSGIRVPRPIHTDTSGVDYRPTTGGAGVPSPLDKMFPPPNPNGKPPIKDDK